MLAIACRNKNFMESVVVSQVDGNVWDLDRPLEADCKLKFLIFEDKDGVLLFSSYLEVIQMLLTGTSMCASGMQYDDHYIRRSS